MEDEYMEFKDWKTGELRKHVLSNHHPGEQKTDLICPLDGTNLLFWFQEGDKGYNCPNCYIEYDINLKKQELVNQYFDKYINDMKNQLLEMDSRRKELSSFLEETEQAFIKNNKANLSAEEISRVIVNKSEAKYRKNLKETQFTKNSRLNH